MSHLWYEKKKAGYYIHEKKEDETFETSFYLGDEISIVFDVFKGNDGKTRYVLFKIGNSVEIDKYWDHLIDKNLDKKIFQLKRITSKDFDPEELTKILNISGYMPIYIREMFEID